MSIVFKKGYRFDKENYGSASVLSQMQSFFRKIFHKEINNFIIKIEILNTFFSKSSKPVRNTLHVGDQIV